MLPSIPTSKPSEHDFTGERDQWEERVFINAELFRVHRFYGQGQHDSQDARSFTDAICIVGSARRDTSYPNARVTLYAVTASGRSTLLPEDKWLRCLELWNQKLVAEVEKVRGK